MSATRLAIVFLLCIAGALSSAANVVHTVRFAQPEVLIAWDEEVLIGQGETVQISGAAEAVEMDFPGSGSLTSAASDIEQSRTIRIASNTGFILRAPNATSVEHVSVRAVDAGPNAAILSSPPADSEILFRQSARTAQRPGSPESQAITLEISWRGDEAPTLVASIL